MIKITKSHLFDSQNEGQSDLRLPNEADIEVQLGLNFAESKFIGLVAELCFDHQNILFENRTRVGLFHSFTPSNAVLI